VAPIPRQEDFGLADAVATLLRSEGRFWYAEDSFLVQFKSRTEKKLTLKGPVFVRWLAQDHSVFVGRVNLVEDTIELFTLGTALLDRRVHEARSLVLWLMKGKEGLHDGVLHLKLVKPILKLSVADTENAVFTDRAYGILKKWLRQERALAGLERAVFYFFSQLSLPLPSQPHRISSQRSLSRVPVRCGSRESHSGCCGSNNANGWYKTAECSTRPRRGRRT
jgi:hypothetical protein